MSGRRLAAWGFVGAVVGMLAGVVWFHWTPRVYESRVVLRKVPRQLGVTLDIGGKSVSESAPEAFSELDVKMIKDGTLLGQVVDELGLQESWNMSFRKCVRRLGETVSAESAGSDELFAILVSHTNAEEARDIAVRLAKVHCVRSRNERLMDLRSSLQEWEFAKAESEKEVEKKRTKLDLMIGMHVPELERIRARLWRERDHLASDLKSLENARNPWAMRYVSVLTADRGGMGGLLVQYEADSKALVALRHSGLLGPKHPEVVRMEMRLKVLRGKMEHQIEVIRDRLTWKIEEVDEQIERIPPPKDHVPGSQSWTYQDVQRAKRELNEAVVRQQRNRTIYIAHRLQWSLFDDPIVIEELPGVERGPVAPSVGICLGVGISGGSALGVVLALVIGLAGKVSGRKG